MNENNYTALFVSKKMTAEVSLAGLKLELTSIYAAPERISAQGEVIMALDEESTFVQLSEARQAGVQRLLVVLMHAPQFPQHELRLQQIARYLEFEEIILSHDLAGLNSWQRMAHLLGQELPAAEVVAGECFFQHWLAEPEWIEQHYSLLVQASEQSKQGKHRHFQALAPQTLAVSEFANTLELMVLRQQGYLERVSAEQPVSLASGDQLLVQEK